MRLIIGLFLAGLFVSVAAAYNGHYGFYTELAIASIVGFTSWIPIFKAKKFY